VCDCNQGWVLRTHGPGTGYNVAVTPLWWRPCYKGVRFFYFPIRRTEPASFTNKGESTVHLWCKWQSDVIAAFCVSSEQSVCRSHSFTDLPFGTPSFYHPHVSWASFTECLQWAEPSLVIGKTCSARKTGTLLAIKQQVPQNCKRLSTYSRWWRLTFHWNPEDGEG
jgi:hypothetical protein